MARIKFVLWERYRAWWGAYQLNKEDPFLIDQMRAEDKEKRKQAIKEEWARMPKAEREERRRIRALENKERQARIEEAKSRQRILKLEAKRDAEMLEEFEKLAVGGKPEDKPGVGKL